jgi:hypothetical protein
MAAMASNENAAVDTTCSSYAVDCSPLMVVAPVAGSGAPVHHAVHPRDQDHNYARHPRTCLGVPILLREHGCHEPIVVLDHTRVPPGERVHNLCASTLCSMSINCVGGVCTGCAGHPKAGSRTGAWGTVECDGTPVAGSTLTGQLNSPLPGNGQRRGAPNKDTTTAKE